MSTPATRHAARAITVLAVLALALPGVAQAAGPAGVTISSCKLDRMTVTGKVALTRKSARKARGALLQMRFQALSLFGLPRVGDWRDVGKKTRASSQQEFTGLSTDNWLGVMNWRFKK